MIFVTTIKRDQKIISQDDVFRLCHKAIPNTLTSHLICDIAYVTHTRHHSKQSVSNTLSNHSRKRSKGCCFSLQPIHCETVGFEEGLGLLLDLGMIFIQPINLFRAQALNVDEFTTHRYHGDVLKPKVSARES